MFQRLTATTAIVLLLLLVRSADFAWAAGASSDSVQAGAPADSIPAVAVPDSASAKPESKPAKPEGERKKSKKSKAKPASGAKEKGSKMEAAAKAGTMPVKPEVLPTHVEVQHILIGFSGSVPGKNITRTQEEAKTLAYQILDRARKGESFDDLVRTYTDDSPPGIYGMSGIGVSPAQGEYPRDRMVPAFGNVGFAISPGNIGIADFDPRSSPYGWHIVKRLK